MNTEREVVFVELHDPSGRDGRYMSACHTLPNGEVFTSEPDRSVFDGYEPGGEFEHEGEYPYTLIMGTEWQIREWNDRDVPAST